MSVSDAHTQEPPPDGGPWLVVQILEPLRPGERLERRYVPAVCAALAAHELTASDLHPAVNDPSTVLARCPDAPLHADALLSAVADLLARRLELASSEAVRVSAYSDLRSAHAAVGDAAG